MKQQERDPLWGTPTSIISGGLYFERPTLKQITQLLPKVILIKAEQAHNLALHTTLQLLASEMADQQPGSEVVANRLAEVLFSQAIRAHVASGGDCRNHGWLRAIFDSQIGAALKAVHESVNEPWTVESLADRAGMSRSAFAARFKELLGQSPLEYVTEWRMSEGDSIAPATRPETSRNCKECRLRIRRCLQQGVQAGSRHHAGRTPPQRCPDLSAARDVIRLGGKTGYSRS